MNLKSWKGAEIPQKSIYLAPAYFRVPDKANPSEVILNYALIHIQRNNPYYQLLLFCQKVSHRKNFSLSLTPLLQRLQKNRLLSHQK